MEDVIKNYSADFMQLKNTKENDWFSKQRQSAFDIFQESGFPNTRVEDWKYTDVKPIAKNTFNPKLDKLQRTLLMLAKLYIPDFRFSSIQINKKRPGLMKDFIFFSKKK